MSADSVVTQESPVPQAVVPAHAALAVVETATAEMQADIQAVATAMRIMCAVTVMRTLPVVGATTLMASLTVMRISGEHCRRRNKGEDRGSQKSEP